jgi:copper(I)-binding protein
MSNLVVLPLLLGAISTQLLAAENAADSVFVMDPYVRAVPPGQPNSAAFMKLQNSSANDHAIVSAESPASEIVELHTHIEEGGMMKMRQIEKIDIPAQGETVLKPGGLHVMLIGLNDELEEGDDVSLTLVFADGSRKQIQAPVRKIAMQMHKHQGHE